MNIHHDTTLGFIAQFSTDFNGDLNAVKTAGFRTTGPPQWFWYTSKLVALNKLRENKPVSGLTISEEAYTAYMRLSEIEARNAEARKLFAPIKEKQAKAKKERKKQELKDRTYTTIVIPEKPGQDYDHIGAEDLPPIPPRENAYVPPPPPTTVCFMCLQPTYFYELADLCLWCEKTT